MRFPIILLRAAVIAGVLVAPLLGAAPGKVRQSVMTYPDGTKKLVYEYNDEGLIHGKYHSFYPDGSPKVQTTYRLGKLSGSYRSYHPGGKVHVRATYRDDLLVGRYQEHDEDGKPVLSADYREGKLHGAVRRYADGRLVNDEYWLDGKLILPKSTRQIASTLAAIQQARVETVGEVPPQAARFRSAIRDPGLHARREAALRLLMAYRFLCDVPYEGMALDWTYIAHCEAASQLLTDLNQMTHNPKNPGWPEAEYQSAKTGAGRSNLFSSSGLVDAVKSFMDDSSEGNIDRLGHRRWCLNPAMLKTGFGGSGKYAAMWSMDAGREDVPDFDFVAFPPRGLVPAESFKEHYAWSVSLNPKKYSKPAEKDVKVAVFPARFDPAQGALEKAPQALVLGHFNVNLGSFGIPNCIIFRPGNVKTNPGAAYWVQITGLEHADGKEATIEYLVVFMNL
jgi:hypothetical protein